MIGKMAFFFFIFAMVKAITPRYRYDQLMRIGWKSLAWVVIWRFWRNSKCSVPSGPAGRGSQLGNEVSNDARATMAFSARRKSVGIAYLLWFFVGFLGVHRFYLGRTKMGVFILAGVLGWFCCLQGLVLIWKMLKQALS